MQRTLTLGVTAENVAAGTRQAVDLAKQVPGAIAENAPLVIDTIKITGENVSHGAGVVFDSTKGAVSDVVKDPQMWSTPHRA